MEKRQLPEDFRDFIKYLNSNKEKKERKELQ
jgi:hypothetical protein